MKSTICRNETLHLLRIEMGPTCGLEFIDKRQNAIRQLFKPFDVLTGKLLARDLRNYVNLQCLAQLV
jgi:hypothetical protein